MLRVLFLLLLISAQASAGPWPRGKGKIFYSLHMNGEYRADINMISRYGTFYAEYGLTEKITLGADYSGSETYTEKAVLFARIPLPNGDRKLLYAAELGIGMADMQFAVRPALSIGRGISWGKRTGWATIDSRAILTGKSASNRLESDLTLGLNSTKRTKVIMQFQAGLPSRGDSYLKFAPSFVFERKPGRMLELGAIVGIHNYDNYAAKLGFWREF